MHTAYDRSVPPAEASPALAAPLVPPPLLELGSLQGTGSGHAFVGLAGQQSGSGGSAHIELGVPGRPLVDWGSGALSGSDAVYSDWEAGFQGGLLQDQPVSAVAGPRAELQPTPLQLRLGSSALEQGDMALEGQNNASQTPVFAGRALPGAAAGWPGPGTVTCL